ncbi:DUF1232 domain-containing protein [Candidatus Microgenomates bacterium]|nr:DUF1232 domain-containing protein [Candidatus Microgenomates bacterium]
MLDKLNRVYGKYKKELRLYWHVVTDHRTPRITKFFLGSAIAYALSPIDIIPDFIPFLGHLDDMILLPFLIWIGMRFVPKDVLRDYRINLQV